MDMWTQNSACGLIDFSPDCIGPLDFDQFVPSAALRLGLPEQVVVKRINMLDDVTRKSHGTQKSHPSLDAHKSQKSLRSSVLPPAFFSKANLNSWPSDSDSSSSCVITAGYQGPHLSHVKFMNNSCVPRKVIQIVALVLRFHPNMKAIVANRGFDQSCIYELAKLLSVSHVTEICLDGNALLESNYYILLDIESSLNNLSLCRCRINDKAAQLIAQRLVYPHPSSKRIVALNLTSNLITDAGAKQLALMLRRNRKLAFLGLGDNMISDAGAAELFDALMTYKYNEKELVMLQDKSASEYFAGGYIEKQPQSATSSDAGKSVALSGKKRLKKSASVSEKKSLTKVPKVEEVIEQPDTFVMEGALFNIGNYVMQWLNVAYNDITLVSLRRLAMALGQQAASGRRPAAGLARVTIVGNPLPLNCEELQLIQLVLNTSTTPKEGKTSRRRPVF